MIPMSSRVFAIDWSGDKKNASKKIWLAEAVDDRLVRLKNGKTREQVAELLIEEAEKDKQFVVALDFAFSFPSWFCSKLQAKTAYDVWAQADNFGEEWLRDCRAPFWGRSGRKQDHIIEEFRQTERDVPREKTRIKPKSTFQIGGAGAVGTGSIRGMSILKRLHDAGFSVWPFDPPGWPLVVEIYPRLLTGPVNKSSQEQRGCFLAEKYPNLSHEHHEAAASCEDAFDAVVSALEMSRRADEFTMLPRAKDAYELIEGRIWY